MPKNKVSEWSSTPGNNTDVGGINIAEGCAPSNINNAIREVMAQIKDMQAGTDGDNFSVGGSLTVAGNVTVTGNISGTYTGTVATATNALSLGGNLANTYALLASPVFTGNPTAPTPVTSDNSTSIATTAYVTNKISAVSSGVVTISGGTTGLTPATATAGAVTLGGTLNLANGGTGATTAATARTNLGATTLGGNIFTITNPSAITFPRFNADNTVSALSAADFRTAIGATNNDGTVTSITAGSYLTSSTAPNPITTTGTLSVNASPTNVANAVVARDSSGNFTAGTITANLNGNASTATSATSATTASSATTATTATNIAGGGAGRVPYNTGSGATAFVAVGTAGQVLVSNGTSAPTFGSAVVSDTVKNATSTAVEFTGIPSWVKRITVLFNGVSLSGTDDILVQIGVSGNYSATYASTCATSSAGGTGVSSSTTGYIIRSQGSGASGISSGIMVIANITGNTWVSSCVGKQTTSVVYNGGGDVALSGVATSIKVIATGTNTFDAGTINIMYE